MQPKLTLTIVSVALVLTGLVFFGFADRSAGVSCHPGF